MMFERATRECATSPTIQIDAPSMRAQAAAQRVDVEQRLRRVLVLAVARVHDRGAAPSRDELRGTCPRRAQHDRVGLVRAQRQDRVLERLALLDARAAGGEIDDVGRQPLGCELEGAAGARRGLVEQVQHHPPPQRRDLLDLAVGDLGEALRPARRCARSPRGRGPRSTAGVPSLLLAHALSCPLPTAVLAIATSSTPSSSRTRTWTCSERDVGRFLPT